MRYPNEEETVALEAALLKRGAPTTDTLDLPLEDHGFAMIVGGLSTADTAFFVNALIADERGSGDGNARRLLFDKLLCWPEMTELVPVKAAKPGIYVSGTKLFDRIAGLGSKQHWVKVEKKTEDEIMSQGISAAALDEARARYHHPGQLWAYFTSDEELEYSHAFLVKTPTDAQWNAMADPWEDYYGACCMLAQPVPDGCIVWPNGPTLERIIAERPAIPVPFMTALHVAGKEFRATQKKGWKARLRDSRKTPPER